MRRIFYGGIIAIPLLLNRVGFGQVLYSITDLGTLGGSTSVATDINNSGQVVGQATTSSGRSDAFFWDDGTMEDLGVIGTDGQSEAFGINNLGQVVGVSGPGDQTGGHAFLWQNGTMTNLGTFDDGYSDQASAINDNGKITGLNWTPTVEYYEGFSWQNGSFTALPSVTPWTTAAQSINASGNIAGFSNSTSQYRLPVAWLNGGTSLVQLPIEPASNGVANGINDSDQIVGSQYVGSYSSIVSDAMLWQNGNATVLGSLGGTNSSASAINDAGSVVGYSYTAGDAAEHAFLYTQSSGMTDLNNLISSSSGWTLSNAAAINNAGQIAATGINSAGQTHAVLLTPHLVTQPVTTIPSSNLTSHYVPTINNLDVYSSANGGIFLNTQSGGTLNTAWPTIVLTLGWNETVSSSQVDESPWVSTMAQAIANVDKQVNIVAWDWSAEADTATVVGGQTLSGGSLSKADSATWNEGLVLGQSLATLLGPNYNQNIQFMGHSLGTLVNSEAISVLEPHILNAKIQDTLFDEASIANHIPGASPSAEAPTIPVIEGTNTPLSLARVDNYISSFGEPYSQAANFILQENPAEPADPSNPFYWKDFHSFPMTWYEGTFPAGTGQYSPVGYAGSIVLGNYNPADPTYETPNYQLQSSSATSEYVFSSQTAQQAAGFVTARNEQEEAIIQNANPMVGNVAAEDVFGMTASQLTGAIQYENSVVATLGPNYGPELALSKQLISTSSLAAYTANNSPAAATSSSSSSYAWVPISIPSNVQYLSFDFTFLDLSPGDFLTVGVNDAPVFELEDQFATNSVAENSGLIDVSQWAGQDIEMFVGLNAADDNNLGGSITLDNFQFVEVPEGSTFCQLLVAAGFLLWRHRPSIQTGIVSERL